MRGKIPVGRWRVVYGLQAKSYTWMMFNGIRRSLFGLLFIALPLQVFASSGLQHCVSMQMPLSHSTGTSAAVDSGASELARQDAPISVSAAAHDCGSPAQGTQTSDSSAGHCAIFAGCGIASAPVPTLLVVVQIPADGIPAATLLAPRVGFMTGAPERPPRTTA